MGGSDSEKRCYTYLNCKNMSLSPPLTRISIYIFTFVAYIPQSNI